MVFETLKSRTPSEAERAFLQRRVGLFGLVVGGCFLFFWLYRIVMIVLHEHEQGFAAPSFWWHLVATVTFLAAWLVCRQGQHGARFVRMVEIATLVLGTIATGIMALYVPLEGRPDFVLLLALSYALLGRSIFIPSSGRLSLLLAAIIGVALFVVVYLAYLGLDRQQWSAIYPDIEKDSAEWVAAQIAIECGIWWVLTSFLSTAASVVIYGLRRRVRRAEMLGEYRLVEKIGEGGMGVVYRASHSFLRRPTAVKLLPPDKAGESNIRRFEQEVQLTASLTHPNTITIFDFGHTSDGVFYYAMEYLAGLPLDKLVARSGAQHPGRVVHLMRQAASALVEAHGVGLVHRDIKPANIMTQLLHEHGGANDFVKVLDFGLVKEMQRDGRIAVTNEASISGTPQYMAPEAIRTPDRVDARSDIYALGAVAYFLLTGIHVFRAQTVVEVLSHQLHSKPEPLSTARGETLSEQLERLVLRCLEKDPTNRPQSAFALEQALAACSDVPAWTPADAQQWWAKYGELSQQASVETSAVMTVEIDHARHAHG